MGDQLARHDAAQAARQQVASSTAFDLVRADAPLTEIRDALSPTIRQALPIAVRAVRQDLQPASDEDRQQIVIALGRQIGLLKAGLAVEHKEDWIKIAFGELAGFPAAMVLDALEEVRRKARFEGDVVPAVLDAVEPKVAALRTELKVIERLCEIIA